MESAAVLAPTSEEQQPSRKSGLRKAGKRRAASSREDAIAKRKKTFNDFFTFCSFVLQYEEQLANNQSLEGNSAGESSHSSTPSPSSPPSPSPSSPSSSSSPSSNHSSAADDLVGDEGVREAGLEGRKGEQAESTDLDSDTSNDLLEYTSDDESWNLVTCFCRRPFAGRPMIECADCSTWVHLYCAKIKKSQVPEVYTCPKCRAASARKARRERKKEHSSSE